MSDSLSIASLQNAYGRVSSWLQTLSQIYYEPARTKQLVKLIRREEKSKTTSILDCACGVGFAAIDLAKLGFQVTGSDASREMLDFAKSNASEKKTAVSFQQSDWQKLHHNVEGTFDCVINLGVNIYHLKGQELVDALQGMKQKLTPNGLLLIDNKRWQTQLQVKNGCHQIRYIESRPPIRVYCPQALEAADGCFYYFFDVAWQEEDRWVIDVVRLPEDKVRNAIRSNGCLLFSLHGLLLSCMVNDNSFAVSISDAPHGTIDHEFPFENIAIAGWPIPSVEIAHLLEQIGMRDIKIFDKFEALDNDPNSNKKGAYDLIVATNSR